MLRQGPEEDWSQDDWFKLAKSAAWLGMSAVELHNLPEPARTFWYFRGLQGNNVEIEAQAKS